MTRRNLEQRLAALEARRDARLDALWERYFARQRELFGDRYEEICALGDAPLPRDVVKQIVRDPQLRALWRVIAPIEGWKDYVKRYVRR